jgi:hypothetical protein
VLDTNIDGVGSCEADSQDPTPLILISVMVRVLLRLGFGV